MDKAYADTVRLLLQVAPDVFANEIFVMKGGTAINPCRDDRSHSLSLHESWKTRKSLNFSIPQKRWIVSLRIAAVADMALIPSILVRATRHLPGRRRLAAIDRGSDRPRCSCLPRIDARMSAQSHRQYRTCQR